MKNLCLLICVVILSGCAAGTIVPLTRYNTGKKPPLNQISEANVGDPIYAEFDYIESSGVRLTEGYNASYSIGTISIPPGGFLHGLRIGDEIQYCSKEKTYNDPVFGPMEVVCFSGAENGTFTKLRHSTVFFVPWRTPEAPVPFKKASISKDAKGKKTELLYEGLSGDTIRVVYREYIDNFARPAFFQEVTYNLNKEGPTELRFKGVKMRILKADNNGIQYVIKNGFAN